MDNLRLSLTFTESTTTEGDARSLARFAGPEIVRAANEGKGIQVTLDGPEEQQRLFAQMMLQRHNVTVNLRARQPEVKPVQPVETPEPNGQA